MSVLIQGLKMPQGESCVTVRIWGDGRVIGVHNDSLVKHAIELPPHGRLIDADALEKHIKKDWEEYDHWIAVEVENRPTVIEAEVEE